LVSVDGSVVDWGNSRVGLVGVGWGSGGDDGSSWNRVSGGNNWAASDNLSVDSIDGLVGLGNWDSLSLVGQLLSILVLDILDDSGRSNQRGGLSNWGSGIGVNLWVDNSVGSGFLDVVSEVSSESLAVDDSGLGLVEDGGASSGDESNENSGGLHVDWSELTERLSKMSK